jgi:hypothetical protein
MRCFDGTPSSPYTSLVLTASFSFSLSSVFAVFGVFSTPIVCFCEVSRRLSLRAEFDLVRTVLLISVSSIELRL